MRAIVLKILLGACGGDDGAHDVVDCDVWWRVRGAEQCERACAAQPMAGVDADHDNNDDSCFVTQAGFTMLCNVALVAKHGAARGCCLADPASDVVQFVACTSQ